MAIKYSRGLCEKMERAITEPKTEKNRFIREGDFTCLRYDEIKMKRVNDIVSVEYLWQGIAVYTTCHKDLAVAATAISITGTPWRMIVSAS